MILLTFLGMTFWQKTVGTTSLNIREYNFVKNYIFLRA